MRFPRRFTCLAAALALLAFGSCRSEQKDAARITVVDAANGVRIASRPALLVGGYGEDDGRVKSVGPVAIDGDGDILIADNILKRIAVFGPDGTPKGSRSYLPGGSSPLVGPDSLRGVQAMTWRDSALFVVSGSDLWVLKGADRRKLDLSGLGSYLRDIAVGPTDDIYALTEDYLKLYDRTGALKDSIGLASADHGSPRARSLAIGPDGSIYVSARTWSRVLVLDPTGKLIRQIGERGSQPGQFLGQAKGIAVDAHGNIYVRDDGANAIKIFRPDGAFVANFGSRGSRPGESLSGEQVVLDRTRRRLVLPDATNFRVQVFDLTARDIEARDVVVHTPEYPLTHRPSQIALALGQNAMSERRVAWKTLPRAVGSQIVYVQVDGADPSEVNWNSPSVQTREGSSVVFTSNIGAYAAHEVALGGLTSGATYAYRVGDGSPEGWSTTSVFRVAETPAERVRVAVLGDSRNRMDVWREIVSAAAADRPAFIVNTGDLVSDGENMTGWNEWFYEARDVLTTIPIMPSLGNHERQSPNYFHSFALPENAPDTLKEQCYSFDYGPAHWVALNTEANLAAQATWLEADLRSNVKPWVFVFFHRPAYAGHPSRGDGNQDVRDAWEDLFVRHGVDVAWQGHDHYYMRTKPVRGGEVVTEGDGPIYVTTGAAGAPLYPIKENRYTAKAESVDHYCIVTATETECTVTVFRRDGTVLDQFALVPRIPETTSTGRTASDLDKLETGE